MDHTAKSASDFMDEISNRFKKPNEVTLIVRRPGYPDQDFMLTNDTANELHALIDRRMKLSEDTAP